MQNALVSARSHLRILRYHTSQPKQHPGHIIPSPVCVCEYYVRLCIFHAIADEQHASTLRTLGHILPGIYNARFRHWARARDDTQSTQRRTDDEPRHRECHLNVLLGGLRALFKNNKYYSWRIRTTTQFQPLSHELQLTIHTHIKYPGNPRDVRSRITSSKFKRDTFCNCALPGQDQGSVAVSRLCRVHTLSEGSTAQSASQPIDSIKMFVRVRCIYLKCRRVFFW